MSVLYRIKHYLTQANQDDRKVGRMLPETGYPNKYTTIYRAVPANITSFKDRDYVTLSRKFAIEHCEHMFATEEEPYHVLSALVKAKDVAEAYNPGEWFWIGPETKGKVVYKARG